MAGPSALRYRNEGNPSLLARLPASAKRVLDVGCGAGDNARVLGSRGHTVWGLTRSPEEAQAAREYCEEVWVGDVEDMALPQVTEPFDALLASHVLEHLVAPERALARLASLLRPGGVLLAAVPNMGHWLVRTRIARGDWSREETGFFDRTHLHFWTFETGAQLLADTPFMAVEVAAVDPSVPLLPLRRSLPALAARLDRTFGHLLPNLVAAQVVVVARLRDDGGSVSSGNRSSREKNAP